MTVERHPIPPGMRLHPLRAGDLTASDIGAVVGVDPHRTALQVYGEKSGMITGAIETPLMRRGRWLEAATLAALREELPEWRIRQAGIYLRDPELHLGATPDLVAEDPEDPSVLVNIQMKVVSKPVFERDWPDETVPLGYQLQTLTEGMLMGAGLSLVAALVIDTYSAELVIRDVPRHAGAEARIRDVARTFWGNVRNGVRPAPDYARDQETIAQLYPANVPDKVLDLTGDNRLAELLPERALLLAQAKAASARVEAIEAEVKDKLGDATAASLGGWKLTWKVEHRKAYQVAASTRRPLRITPPKEDAA